MSTDDTMRRIEEAVDAHAYAEITGPYILACELRAKLFATIRAALQPDAGGWGEDDVQHAIDSLECEVLPHVDEERCQVVLDVIETLRLMRRQPKETTDGK